MAMNAPTDLGVFRALFDAYPDGVLLVDGTGHILLANPAAVELLGYEESRLVGMTVDALVPDSVASVHASHRNAYARNPRQRPMGTDIEFPRQARRRL